MNSHINFALPRPKKQLISLTPLIDVVFILLVFFMLTSQLHRWYMFDAAHQTTPTSNQTNSQSLHILIEPDHYQVNQQRFARPMDIELIKEQLALNAKTNLIIEPSINLGLQDLIDALDLLHQSDVKDYQLFSQQQ